MTRKGTRDSFGEPIPVFDFHYMGRPIDIYKRMNIYIIDFGLSMVVDDIKTVHTVDNPRGTHCFFLHQLIDIKSNLITDDCRTQLCLSDQFYSCSILNDRLAMCRNIVELMMGHLWEDEELSDHWIEDKHNYISFTSWLFEHKPNECSSELKTHTKKCIPFRNTWRQYKDFRDFLIMLSDPNTFIDATKDLDWWKNAFKTVIANI